MKRLLAAAMAAVASAMIATPAFAASHAASKTFGSCRAQGDFAICTASGTANDPATIKVHVSASPAQKVLVTWDMTCLKGTGAGGSQGQFKARAPLSRALHHPYAHPDSCIVAAGAMLWNGSGHLHVWLTYTR